MDVEQLPYGLPPEVYTASLGYDGRRKGALTNAPARKNGVLANMWQRNHEIVNLHMAGFKNTEIAEILNISAVTVSNTINSDIATVKIDALRQERDRDAIRVQERIRILRNKALDTYDEFLTPYNEDGTPRAIPVRDRLAVANTVMLEFSGFRVPVRTESTTFSMSATELAELKRRGLEQARASGLITDTTAEPVQTLNEHNNSEESSLL